ncbi:Zn-dependent exopeptidase, partial [Thelephora ganbajun]
MLVNGLFGLFFFTTSLKPAEFVNQGCLSDNYYGTYGETSLFLLSPYSECLASLQATAPPGYIESGVLSTAKTNYRLMYIQKMPVLDSTDSANQLAKALERLNAYTADLDSAASDSQTTLGLGGHDKYSFLHYTGVDAIISVPPHLVPHIDKALPPSFKAYAIPTEPLSITPVPDEAVHRVKGWLKRLKFDEEIASIVSDISVPQMRNDIRYLTGEDSGSPILSRHSFSEGARIAANWLRDRIENTGAQCELRQFLVGFAPNVICRYESLDANAGTVIMSAHYDSRGSFGSTRHPGADDDGSGTTAILAIARAISRKRIQFKSHVELVAFAGEEQGLWGSRYYSRELRDSGANVTLMVQSDMLAYHAPGEHAQLAFPDAIGTPEVAHLVANVSALYSPELELGLTPACCSDHQPFHENGFPATQLFERAGPIADPMYHNTGDVSEREGFDLNQLRSIAKVQLATLLHVAGYEI